MWPTALILFFSTCGVWGALQAADINNVVSLNSEDDQYYLGPYTEYLEDPTNSLTIETASLPEMNQHYVRYSNQIINLGVSSSSYWFRFNLIVSPEAALKQRWYLDFGWPNHIDIGQLYIPGPASGSWLVKDVGLFQQIDRQGFPSIPVELDFSELLDSPTAVYLHVERATTLYLPLRIITETAYRRLQWSRLVLSGVYYGIILSMILYNAILLISLRELSRLFYIVYLISMVLLFFSRDGGLFLAFDVDIHLAGEITYIALFAAYFWAILFAKSFLLTRTNSPGLDRVLSLLAGVAFLTTVFSPFIPQPWPEYMLNTYALIVPPIFILTSAVCLKRGFRPARFLLIAFFSVASGTLVSALAFYEILPASSLTFNGAQIGSALEVILLQLAFVDRVNTLQRERDQIKHSLNLAGEIQHSLLPKSPPRITGLDIAGRSRYCDETGGDHFDFLQRGKPEEKRLGIVVSDVSGHGISSALLMATARSAIRQRASMPGGPAEIVSDVNGQISMDVDESGQFLTLFYCEIDLVKMSVDWVSAGHDPAILYHYKDGSFYQLQGRGPALGLVGDFQYKESSKALSAGNLILIATDGVWEAHNPFGEMFGKERLKQTIQKYGEKSAGEIVNLVIQEVEQFSHPNRVEDDVTLVVAKI